MFWLSYLILWILVIVLTAAMLFVFRHQSDLYLDSIEGRKAQGPALGQDLDLTVLLGRPSQIKNLHERTFMLFGSTECAPCMKALREFAVIHARHPEIQCVAVYYVDAAARNDSDFLRQVPSRLVLIDDSKGDIMRRFNISRTPMAVVVSQDGRVMAKGMPNTVKHMEALLAASKQALQSSTTEAVEWARS